MGGKQVDVFSLPVSSYTSIPEAEFGRPAGTGSWQRLARALRSKQRVGPMSCLHSNRLLRALYRLTPRPVVARRKELDGYYIYVESNPIGDAYRPGAVSQTES